MSESDCSELSRLQFIICQLENAFVHKKKRRYNMITQISWLYKHISFLPLVIISPTFRLYLVATLHTLEKLYSSFGIQNDFSTYLSQVISSFTTEENNVIVQMDEIHENLVYHIKVGKYLVSI